MTLQQIIFFKEIAHVKNFTLAAQNVFNSQSNLSYSIQALERELGAPLFVRQSGKLIELTKYGQAFLPYAKKIIEEIKEAEQTIAKMRNPNTGLVTITYSYVNGFSLVPKIFNQFYIDNSSQEIVVQFQINHLTQRYVDSILSNDADLAIGCSSYERLEALPIAKQKLVIFLPKRHPLANNEKLTLYDLKDEQLICYCQGSSLDNLIIKMYKESKLKMNVYGYFLDWFSQVSHVSLGRGFAIVPNIPVDKDMISVLELDHPLSTRDICLFWNASRKMTEPVEYVKNYCIEFCKKMESPFT